MSEPCKEAIAAFFAKHPHLNKPQRPRVSVDEEALQLLEVGAIEALERGKLEPLAAYLDAVKSHANGCIVSSRLVDMLRMMIGTDGVPDSPYQLAMKLGPSHKGRPKKSEREKTADNFLNQYAYFAFEAAGGFEPVGYRDGKAVGQAVGIAAAAKKIGLKEETVRTTLLPLFKEEKWRQDQIAAGRTDLIEAHYRMIRETDSNSRRRKPLIPKT